MFIKEEKKPAASGLGWSWLGRGSHLMSPEQGSPPIHVVLRLDHIYHLVGVQLEPTLQFIQAIHILHALLAISFLPFLFLLFSTTLTLPDPPQVPTKQKAMNDESWSRQISMTPPRVFLIICLHRTHYNFSYIHIKNVQ